MVRWIEDNLVIKPKKGGLQPFRLNRFQKILIAKIVKYLREGKPIRLIILKSRQLGISTLVEAVIFYLLHQYPSTTGFVVAHRKDSATNIFNMMKRFWHNMEREIRKPLERGRPNRDNFQFEPPHSSQCVVATAGGEEVGRGWTINFVHVSELAFYNDAETTMTALNQAVPNATETSFSFYIIESTANGLNMFKDYWDSAHSQDSEWEPIFFSWCDDPLARIDPAPGQQIIWTPEEETLRTTYNLSDGQMLWARHIWKNKCHAQLGEVPSGIPYQAGVGVSFNRVCGIQPECCYTEIGDGPNHQPTIPGRYIVPFVYRTNATSHRTAIRPAYPLGASEIRE